MGLFPLRQATGPHQIRVLDAGNPSLEIVIGQQLANIASVVSGALANLQPRGCPAGGGVDGFRKVRLVGEQNKARREPHPCSRSAVVIVLQ